MTKKTDNNKKPQKCCWDKCKVEGLYLAPKSPDNLQEYYVFCKEHIREYNKKWDFFAGKSQDEIEKFHIDSMAGHRATFKRGVGEGYYDAEYVAKRAFEEFREGSKARKPRKQVPKADRDALEVLELIAPVTLKDIKNRYKQLVKLHHPDINKKADDEKIKIINRAYNHLKEAYKDDR